MDDVISDWRRKIGVTIQFESHRVELAAIYAMEHDPLTLQFPTNRLRSCESGIACLRAARNEPRP